MKPYTIIHGDCITEMSKLLANSVDAIVTDPPYGIRFMGKAWDGADIDARAATRRGFASQAPGAGPNGGHKSIAAEAGKYDLAPSAMRAFQEFSEEWAREAFRVLKPGGYLLSFSSARTFHRMTCGIEDAGFEIRDQLLWIYGSGFPKSHNLTGGREGWGTALKPAHEPICMARKPFKGTVATNVLAHGTGAINIDACRVEPTGESRDRVGEASQDNRYASAGATNFAATPGPRGGDAAGRWPANLITDGSPEVVALFPESSSGAMKSSTQRAAQDEPGSVCFGTYGGAVASADIPASAGSAARFFYCAKTSPADRHEGLEHPGQQFKQGTTLRDVEVTDTKGNNHPTVKPTDLMAYLVRLVTPPGGKVLDPFMGSGSTGKACMREGFAFIGIDLTAEYIPIATARIEFEHAKVAAAAELAAIPAPQLDMFAGEVA